MRSRLVSFFLGAAAVAGMSAAPGTCPSGFRCAGAETRGESCLIEEGPFRGQPGVQVDGRCLRSAEASAAAVHTHVIEPGHCPLCGGEAEVYLSFNVQAAAAPASSRPLLRCLTCGNLFADVP